MSGSEVHTELGIERNLLWINREIDWSQDIDQLMVEIKSCTTPKGNNSDDQKNILQQRVTTIVNYDGEKVTDILNEYGIVVAQIKDTKYQGLKKCWLHYNNGVLCFSGYLKNGYRAGCGIGYDSYGIRVFQGVFEKGVRSGKGREYDENGYLLFKGLYDQDKREGMGTEYYSNGKVCYKGFFHQGLRQWKGVEFDESGQGTKVFYDKGIKSLRFVPSTELKNYWVETDLEQNSVVLCQIDEFGKRFGIGYFYNSGNIQHISRWDQGTEVELLKSFCNHKMVEYSKGTKVYEGDFEDSLLLQYGRNGNGIEYEPDGVTVKYSGSFIHGKRNGKGIAYRNHMPVYNGTWVNNHRLWIAIVLQELCILLLLGVTAFLFLLFHFSFEFWFIIPVIFLWRRFSVIRCEADLMLATNNNLLKRHLVVRKKCCNVRHSLTFHISLLTSIEIGDDCFQKVKVFKIDGLFLLKRIKIGSNSFTKKQNTYGDNKSKSFHILNCESLESIQIGEYSFSDFGGEIELRNLKSLKSIQIGTIGKYSYNFYSSTFVIRGMDSILCNE